MKRIIFFLMSGFFFWSCNKEDDIKLTSDFEGKFTFISSPDPELNAYELFTLDRDGLKQVTFTDTVGFYKGSPLWVKNGDYIQYEEYSLCLFCNTYGRNKIIRADGSEPKNYTMPYISPDNKHGCTYNYGNLYIFNLDDNLNKLNQIGSLVYVTYGSAIPVKWATDSERLLYKLDNDTSRLVDYNINTKKITTLFEFDDHISDVTNFEWSYVGDKIAFIWLDDVYVVNADGSNIQNLTSSPN
jgi:hypothetical protein